MSDQACVPAHSLRQLVMAGEIMAVVLDRGPEAVAELPPADYAHLVSAWRNIATDVRKAIDAGKVPC